MGKLDSVCNSARLSQTERENKIQEYIAQQPALKTQEEVRAEILRKMKEKASLLATKTGHVREALPQAVSTPASVTADRTVGTDVVKTATSTVSNLAAPITNEDLASAAVSYRSHLMRWFFTMATLQCITMTQNDAESLVLLLDEFDEKRKETEKNLRTWLPKAPKERIEQLLLDELGVPEVPADQKYRANLENFFKEMEAILAYQTSQDHKFLSSLNWDPVMHDNDLQKHCAQLQQERQTLYAFFKKSTGRFAQSSFTQISAILFQRKQANDDTRLDDFTNLNAELVDLVSGAPTELSLARPFIEEFRRRVERADTGVQRRRNGRANFFSTLFFDVFKDNTEVTSFEHIIPVSVTPTCEKVWNDEAWPESLNPLPFSDAWNMVKKTIIPKKRPKPVQVEATTKATGNKPETNTNRGGSKRTLADPKGKDSAWKKGSTDIDATGVAQQPVSGSIGVASNRATGAPTKAGTTNREAPLLPTVVTDTATVFEDSSLSNAISSTANSSLSGTQETIPELFDPPVTYKRMLDIIFGKNGERIKRVKQYTRPQLALLHRIREMGDDMKLERMIYFVDPPTNPAIHLDHALQFAARRFEELQDLLFKLCLKQFTSPEWIPTHAIGSFRNLLKLQQSLGNTIFEELIPTTLWVANYTVSKDNLGEHLMSMESQLLAKGDVVLNRKRAIEDSPGVDQDRRYNYSDYRHDENYRRRVEQGNRLSYSSRSSPSHRDSRSGSRDSQSHRSRNQDNHRRHSRYDERYYSTRHNIPR